MGDPLLLLQIAPKLNPHARVRENPPGGWLC